MDIQSFRDTTAYSGNTCPNVIVSGRPGDGIRSAGVPACGFGWRPRHQFRKYQPGRAIPHERIRVRISSRKFNWHTQIAKELRQGKPIPHRDRRNGVVVADIPVCRGVRASSRAGGALDWSRGLGLISRGLGCAKRLGRGGRDATGYVRQECPTLPSNLTPLRTRGIARRQAGEWAC